MIPPAHPLIGDIEVDAVAAVLRSGSLAQGPETAAFEREFAAYCEVGHAIACSSGTSALHTALLSLGIGPGDEVVVPAFTFFATASSVAMTGARPVFADVNEETYTLDPDSVELSLGPATKAVIGVHLFGMPCDMVNLSRICQDHNLFFIEDAAQAHGARYRGSRVGSLGTLGCFSFYATKNMTTGEGGMITTGDPSFAARCRMIINHGQEEKYYHTVLGYNYRMTDIAAAIGRVQLRRLDVFNETRRRNARLYGAGLSHPGVIQPHVPEGSDHVYHQYVVRINAQYPYSRDELNTRLHAQGIGSAVHYPIPLNKQPIFRSHSSSSSCPVATRLAGEVLSLPVHPSVREDDIQTICRYINEVN
jgi:perosamine synthetase